MSQIPMASIPDNWRLERLDRLFQIRNEPARIDDPPISAFIDGTVTLRSNRPDAIIKGSGQEIGYKHIEVGDLVISGMNAHLGGLGISDSSGKCTPVYTVMKKIIDLDSRFISYYLWHAAKSGYIKSLVNAVRYNSADFGPETIKRFMVPLPPIEEQRRIADYLDLRIGKSKQFINARRSQCELLDIYLQSEITSDISNMQSNKTEIELRYLIKSLIIGSTPDENLIDEDGLPWYSPASIDNFGCLGDPVRIIPKKVQNERITIFPENSLLMVCIGTAGKVAYLDHPASGNQQLTCMVPNEMILPKYLYYYFYSQRENILSRANFTTLPILNNDFLRTLRIPIPPLSVQESLIIKWDKLRDILENARLGILRSVELEKELMNSRLTSSISGQSDPSVKDFQNAN